jgi:WD40 repeat protein
MHHVGPIAGVAAHGPWVATAGYDNRLILWDASSRQAVARAAHDHLVNACAFSADGRWLVSASSDYSARVWSLPDLRLHAVLAGHGDDVDMACPSPDGSLVATCALDRLVRVFDAQGACQHTLAGHTGNVLSLAWIDVGRFVTTSVDGTLREWDAAAGEALRCITLGMRSDCVVVAPGGRLYAGDDLGRLAVIDGNAPPQFVNAHAAGIKKLVLAGDGTQLVSLGYDRMLAVWRVDAAGLPQQVARSLMPPAIWARSAAVCADGRIAVGTFGGTYALFDPASGQWDMADVEAGPAINAALEAEGVLLTLGDAGRLLADGAPAGGPGSLCNFLADAGGQLFTGGHLGELYDARSGQVLFRHSSPLNCGVGFVRGGMAHLAVGTYTGEILIFALAGAMPQLVQTLRPYVHAIKGLAVGDGLLFSVCANTDIAWHNVDDWREQKRLPRAHTRIANACCALGQGAFASVGRDRMLRLWLPEGALAIATPHPNSVKCLAASPCGRWIASGSYGGTLAVFDRNTMGFVSMARISKAGVAALCWSARANGFVAASYDGGVQAVPLPSVVPTPMRAAA